LLLPGVGLPAVVLGGVVQHVLLQLELVNLQLLVGVVLTHLNKHLRTGANKKKRKKAKRVQMRKRRE
jgi:hypothetical protein